MHHEIVSMQQPELMKNEITLPLIENGCAVQYPPGLVNIVENGQSSSAKFEVSYCVGCIYIQVYRCYLYSVFGLDNIGVLFVEQKD